MQELAIVTLAKTQWLNIVAESDYGRAPEQKLGRLIFYAVASFLSEQPVVLAFDDKQNMMYINIEERLKENALCQ